MKGNIFAGVLEGLGKALGTYGQGQIEQTNKLAQIDKSNESTLNLLRAMGYNIPGQTAQSSTNPVKKIPMAPATTPSQIQVIELSNGQRGTIPAEEFDPKVYKRVQ